MTYSEAEIDSWARVWVNMNDMEKLELKIAGKMDEILQYWTSTNEIAMANHSGWLEALQWVSRLIVETVSREGIK